MALLALATSCAGSYAPIRPDRIAPSQASGTNAPVELGHQFDAPRLHGNKKYVKKEAKRGYHVAAVRVTNNSGRELNVSRDTNPVYGDRPIVPVAGAVAAQNLKRGVGIYRLCLLLNFNVGGTVDARTGAATGGTFIPTGPFIAGGNVLGASQANRNVRNEFEAFDPTNRAIKPGETVYGILSVRETSGPPCAPNCAPAPHRPTCRQRRRWCCRLLCPPRPRPAPSAPSSRPELNQGPKKGPANYLAGPFFLSASATYCLAITLKSSVKSS